MFPTLRRCFVQAVSLHCLVFLLFFFNATHANEYKTMKWDTELCSCQAKVDVNKLNPELIIHLSDAFRSFATSREFDWWDYRDAKVEQLISEQERFKQQTREQIKRLNSLQLPDNPLIEKYHSVAVRGIKLTNHMYLAELDFLITGNTTEFKKDFLGEKLLPKCKRWARIVESKEDTYKILPTFIEQKCSNNAYPKRCENKSLTKALNDFRSAQLEILMFGWHNCANHQFRLENVHDYTGKALKEINPYLKDKVCECYEP
jgi:hypothetical protein